MARGVVFPRRGAFPRFRDPDDFRGVMKWIVALKVVGLLNPVSDLSKHVPDR
jgi:hypothetical protein